MENSYERDERLRFRINRIEGLLLLIIKGPEAIKLYNCASWFKCRCEIIKAEYIGNFIAAALYPCGIFNLNHSIIYRY